MERSGCHGDQNSPSIMGGAAPARLRATHAAAKVGGAAPVSLRADPTPRPTWAARRVGRAPCRPDTAATWAVRRSRSVPTSTSTAADMDGAEPVTVGRRVD
ncbi:hypothetical protein GCM10007977_095750 [Dactylosporangium sucinum]|uniref:Uncharacterized protein n=1 Tax=Dactylosporangium sucinum TaxID=1424081 RepID=A0A917X6D4_9ACTN|nr:hypothetical protein GCM10007977_095750 [Dactylosporangium sucinum]